MQAAVAVPVVAEATAVPVQAAVAVPVVAAPAVAVAPAGGGGGCCSGNKAIHITQMTFGIFNILSGLNAVSPLNELPFYEWGVVAFLLGISSMVAASMYNPCLCCPCGTPTTATKLKTIAVVSMAAGVLALVGLIVFGVTLGDISASDWGAVAEYTCCPGERRGDGRLRKEQLQVRLASRSLLGGGNEVQGRQSAYRVEKRIGWLR